jgi:hypothetical protein
LLRDTVPSQPRLARNPTTENITHVNDQYRHSGIISLQFGPTRKADAQPGAASDGLPQTFSATALPRSSRGREGF